MRPSVSIVRHREQVRAILAGFRMSNARLFGSAARGDDTEASDLDVLVDVPPGTTLYDLAQAELELEGVLGCRVEVVTNGFLASDVAENVEADLVPLP